MRFGLATRLIALIALIAPLPAWAAQPVTHFKLENGMDVVVIEDNRAPVVTHMVWYRVGAADEPWGKSGIAHFFEHLMFKATDDLEAGEFSRIVSENGGQGNAFTSWDYTAYFQRIAKDRLGLMMSLEAERMTDLVLTDEVVDTERDVIIEERNSRTDNDPGSLLSEQTRAALYLNHPYGVPIIGWRHEIEALGLDDAEAFYERYYAPDNAILVVAGDVTPDEVRTLAEEHYGPLEPSGRPADARPAEPPQISPRRVELSDERVRQPYVVRNYLVPSYGPGTEREAAALSLLSSVLGGGITSRLRQALEVEEKLAVNAGAGYFATAREQVAFSIYGVPAPGRTLDEMEAGLDRILAEVVAGGVTEDELDRIKTRRNADLIYRQDDIASQARLYGMALSVGLGVEDVQGWPDLIQSITPEEVRAAAERWLVPARSVTARLLTKDGEAG